ncbi:MAG: DUF547 domain-containing protein, partial [Nitrospinota bacterium]|nr:DUF547 domain-containing protein [Nitrospinota bacterium]
MFSQCSSYINRQLNARMIIFLLILTIIMISPLLLEQTYAWNTSTPVSKVLEDLGDPLADHAIEYTEAMVQRGKDIVLKGQTIGPDGSLSEKQSVYFVCTDCHNIKREDPDPRYSDPTARLSYAKKNNLQFLPATTLYGMVNRTSWFNDSYILLYGDTILPGHKNLRKAVQICSEVCSSGRRLKKWELDSLMAYFWTIELKLGDLNLSADDWKTLKKAEANPVRHKELIPWLKSFYFKASPATFDSPPERLSIGYRGLVGDPERGEDVYKLACLNCHAEEGGSSHYELDLSIHTIRPLYENRAKQNRRSFYNAIRDGIYFKYVRPYMPQYSLERMTDQQIEDLNAYLESKAKSTVRSRIASGTTFDFSDWDVLLKKYTHDITKENVHLTSIKYIFLKNDKQFKYLIRKLEKFPVDSLKSSNEKLSFWINVYNIMAVKIISDHYPVKSIQDIGTWFDLVWNKNAGIVGGKAYSLNDIEHRILRKMGDPRIHAAIVCASVSCPDLATFSYKPEDISEQLDNRFKDLLANKTKGFFVHQTEEAIYISQIFKWFKKDFQQAGGIINILNKYAPANKMEDLKHLESGKYSLRYFDFNWSLNE